MKASPSPLPPNYYRGLQILTENGERFEQTVCQREVRCVSLHLHQPASQHRQQAPETHLPSSPALPP